MFEYSEQGRIDVLGDAEDATVLRVDLQLEGHEVLGVGLNPLRNIVQVGGLDRDVDVLVEGAVGDVDPGRERGGQLGVDVDRDVLDGDAGVLLVEHGDRRAEDLIEVAGTVPDGDRAFRRTLNIRGSDRGCGRRRQG